MNERDEKIEHNLKRRMFQTLMIPTPKLQYKRKTEVSQDPDRIQQNLGLFSCLEMLAYIEDSGASEALMKIAMSCDDASSICFASSEKDLKQLLTTKLANTTRLLDGSFCSTFGTR